MHSRDLLLAVLAELRNLGVTPSKTKLLKLVYLIDLETYRSVGRLATEWDWRFLHFGPWAPQYDDVLSQLAKYDALKLQGFGRDERATLVLTERTDADASKLEDVDVQMAIGRILTRWAKADLPDILNFVYFDTEPMRDAEREQPLDFSKVPRGRYPIYRRRPSDATPAVLKAFRERMREVARQPDLTQPSYTASRYDDEVLRALAAIEDD